MICVSLFFIFRCRPMLWRFDLPCGQLLKSLDFDLPRQQDVMWLKSHGTLMFYVFLFAYLSFPNIELDPLCIFSTLSWTLSRYFWLWVGPTTHSRYFLIWTHNPQQIFLSWTHFRWFGSRVVYSLVTCQLLLVLKYCPSFTLVDFETQKVLFILVYDIFQSTWYSAMEISVAFIWEEFLQEQRILK